MAIDLNTLKKTTTDGLPPIITIYGLDGVGKTGFALGAPDVAYAPTEPRFGHYEVTNLFQSTDDPYRVCGGYDDMVTSAEALLTQEHGFKTFVLDSADHFEPQVWQRVIEAYPTTEKGKTVNDITDYGWGDGFVKAKEAWIYLFDLLNRLRREKGMAIIIIAHYQIKVESLADMDEIGQFQIKLNKQAASYIREISDIVVFAKLKQFTREVGEGDKKKKQATGNAERILVCQPSLAYTVKNSFDMPAELPLDWDTFAQYIPYFNK